MSKVAIRNPPQPDGKKPGRILARVQLQRAVLVAAGLLPIIGKAVAAESEHAAGEVWTVS
jgi:hypothetical protein